MSTPSLTLPKSQLGRWARRRLSRSCAQPSFFLNDTATNEIYTLSLHDALPIWQRLDRLVADLLVLARLEAADFPVELLPVDLTDLVRTAADAWAARCAGVGLVLRTELPGGPVQVRTDPGRLRQVIDGLLENALRVVPPGAPVVLAVRTDPASAVVEVRDGGPGFTDDDLAVAFERGALYQRYQGVRAVGSGLGLALAARLVRR